MQVAHNLTVGGTTPSAIAVEDSQNIIYRSTDGVDTSALSRHDIPDEDHTQWAWGHDVAIDPTLLFRFSALTYNAHRIHYDRGYATGEEGYPGLVVHGPLQAILIADAASRTLPTPRALSITYRAIAPAFDSSPLKIRLAPTADSGERKGTRAVVYSGGHATMTATLS